jgi:hypothetical protein
MIILATFGAIVHNLLDSTGQLADPAFECCLVRGQGRLQALRVIATRAIWERLSPSARRFTISAARASRGDRILQDASPKCHCQGSVLLGFSGADRDRADMRVVIVDEPTFLADVSRSATG